MTISPEEHDAGLPELPYGWEWVRLADLAADEPRAITDGPFGSNLKTAHYTEEGPRVIRLQNVGEGRFLDARAHISAERFDALRAHDARPGDIVVASLGEELPRACLVPPDIGPAIVKADCPRIRPRRDIDARYLMLALNSPPVRAQAAVAIHGVGRPRLKLAELKKLYVPVAPRSQQAVIAARVTAALEALDGASTMLEHARGRLAHFRAATLQTEMTAAERTCHLADVAEVVSGITKGRKTKEALAPQPFLRAANLKDGYLDLDEVKGIEVTDREAQKYRLVEGDVLLVEGSGSAHRLGQGWLWEDQVPGCLHQNHVFRARADRSLVRPRFLAWVMQSPASKRYFHSVSKTTSGLTTMNKRQLSALEIPLPSLIVQDRIVAQLDEAAAGAARFETLLDRQAGPARSLRRSVLAAAFLGRLPVEKVGADAVGAADIERAVLVGS